MIVKLRALALWFITVTDEPFQEEGEESSRKGGWAIVDVTLSVPVGGWGDACTIGQVRRQAQRSALNRVRAAKPPPGCRIKAVKVRPMIAGPED